MYVMHIMQASKHPTKCCSGLQELTFGSGVPMPRCTELEFYHKAASRHWVAWSHMLADYFRVTRIIFLRLELTMDLRCSVER